MLHLFTKKTQQNALKCPLSLRYTYQCLMAAENCHTNLQFPLTLWSILVSFSSSLLLFWVLAHSKHSDKPAVHYLSNTKGQTDDVNG